MSAVVRGAATDTHTSHPVQRLDRSRGAVQAYEDGFAHLVIHKAHLELRFFDHAGARVEAPRGHAVVIYRSPAHQRETTILNPTDDGLALRSVDVIDGPYAFHARINLFRPDASDPARTFEFNFTRGSGRT